MPNYQCLCAYCGGTFEAPRSFTRFCSNSHRTQHSQRSVHVRFRHTARQLMVDQAAASLARSIAILKNDVTELRRVDRMLGELADRFEMLFASPPRFLAGKLPD